MTVIAILGLGEAGRLYARGLRAAGARVRGYDPVRDEDAADIERIDDVAGAVAGADVVLALTGAHAATAIARDAMPHLPATAVYADLNTASPTAKIEVAAIAAAHGIRMADVAVLAPVPRAGHRTPLLVTGPGRADVVRHLAPLGVPVESLDGAPGEAARLKLLRTVFMKGLATLVIESLGAAEAAGHAEWLRAQITGELGPDGHDLVERLVAGTYAHAHRREHEVRDALAELEASGQHADMTRATLAWFERILAERGDAG